MQNIRTSIRVRLSREIKLLVLKIRAILHPADLDVHEGPREARRVRPPHALVVLVDHFPVEPTVADVEHKAPLVILLDVLVLVRLVAFLLADLGRHLVSRLPSDLAAANVELGFRVEPIDGGAVVDAALAGLQLVESVFAQVVLVYPGALAVWPGLPGQVELPVVCIGLQRLLGRGSLLLGVVGNLLAVDVECQANTRLGVPFEVLVAKGVGHGLEVLARQGGAVAVAVGLERGLLEVGHLVACCVPGGHQGLLELPVEGVGEFHDARVARAVFVVAL